MDPKVNSERVFAVEFEGKPFFPIQDHRYNICALQKENGSFAQWCRYTAFGKKFLWGNSSLSNPWGFANRREVGGLCLFSHRFYNPSLCRWLTKDPMGFDDGLNLYAYVHNNPFYYSDPDGRFAIAVPLVVSLFEITFGATVSAVVLPAIGATVAVALVSYGCYEIGNYVNNQMAEQDEEKEKKRSEDVYGPDRKLPRDKYGDPIPDADAPHTQLGKKQGRKRKYTQAREFDDKGRPIRDIDFTDHGRPHDHTNPHQHTHDENKTGGTPKRNEEGQPVPEWEY
jgi:RHS repeat-associated protein